MIKTRISSFAKYSKDKSIKESRLEEIILILKNEIGEGNVLEVGNDYYPFLKKNKRRFNLIVFLNILEKFNNPKAVISRTKKLLKPGGLILILTPNKKSHIKKLKKHTYKFSPETLQKLLNKTRLEVKYLTTFESFHDYKEIYKKDSRAMFYGLPKYFLFRKFAWLSKRGGFICVIAAKKG